MYEFIVRLLHLSWLDQRRGTLRWKLIRRVLTFKHKHLLGAIRIVNMLALCLLLMPIFCWYTCDLFEYFLYRIEIDIIVAANYLSKSLLHQKWPQLFLDWRFSIKILTVDSWYIVIYYNLFLESI
jgi:hypothetical protein